MKIYQLAQCLDVPLRPTWRFVHETFLDSPTTDEAGLASCGQFVWYNAHLLSSEALVESILHELCHAYVGTPSIYDELDSGMMPLQWKLMHELYPSDFQICRRIWSDYGFPWRKNDPELVAPLIQGGEIGFTDKFLRTKTWKSAVKNAIAADLLTRDGRIIWGQGSRFR